MNAISDKFSLKRMWTVVGHYCVANARDLLIRAAVMFGLIFLIALLLTKMVNEDPVARASMIGLFFVMAAGLLFTVIGSMTFNSYSSKPKRIAAMMLPATKLEKFLAMSLIYVVFGNIFVLLTLFLSDTLTASLFGLRSAVSYLPEIFDNIFYKDPESKRFILPVSLGIAWFFFMSQAIYLIGSAMWPKLSFLKTFIVINVFQTVLSIFIPFYHFGDWLGKHFEFFFEYFDNIDKIYALVWSSIAVSYLIILPGLYALAWLRFRNLAVAKRFLS
ncbi:MAG: hypothetical protein K2N10_01405 [Muribaculaceae bacterium]|nr:hypothetical protein [Muribaculaceae bacterium]